MIAINYLKQKSLLDNEEWDWKTVTPPDFSVELTIKPNIWKNWLQY